MLFNLLILLQTLAFPIAKIDSFQLVKRRNHDQGGMEQAGGETAAILKSERRMKKVERTLVGDRKLKVLKRAKMLMANGKNLKVKVKLLLVKMKVLKKVVMLVASRKLLQVGRIIPVERGRPAVTVRAELGKVLELEKLLLGKMVIVGVIILHQQAVHKAILEKKPSWK